ncbi:CHAT domain-containing protein [Campylobacter concisus]|uniref:CHAT domain-containing protein n=1 Tax=Campylobacter concisus TaxID=199 RepID=UPI000D3278C1|nr:CHAT domain-containing tetratricopeptide repeat protein [Campylobacter concisus]
MKLNKKISSIAISAAVAGILTGCAELGMVKDATIVAFSGKIEQFSDDYERLAKNSTNRDYDSLLRNAPTFLKRYDKQLGKASFSRLHMYEYLGFAYSELGEYQEALNYYNKIIEAEDDPNGFWSLQAKCYIGSVYARLGDFDRGRKLCEDALSIAEDKYKGNDLGIIEVMLSSIGGIYMHAKNFQKSLEYSLKAANLQEKNFDTKKTSGIMRLAAIYVNAAVAYTELKEYNNALSYLQRSLDLTNKYAPKSNLLMYIYINLAYNYKEMKEYDSALNYYDKAINMMNRTYGVNNHINFAGAKKDISNIYADKQDYQKAYTYAKESMAIFDTMKNQNFKSLDNDQKKAFLDANKEFMPNFLDIGSKAMQQRPDIIKDMYKIFINSKDSLLDAENSIYMLRQTTTNSFVASKIDELNALKKEYAGLSRQSFEGEDEKEAEKLEKERKEKLDQTQKNIKNLESELSAMSSNFKEILDMKNISIQDVTKFLNQDELLIDIGYYDEKYYIFSVDKNQKVDLVVLSKSQSNEINQDIKKFRDDIEHIISSGEQSTKATQLSKELSSNIYKTLFSNMPARINSYKNLIIAADGALRLFPFEALRDNNGYLIENKNIRYIASAKEFVRAHKYNQSSAKEPVTMFSDPDYDNAVGTSDKTSSSSDDIVLTRSLSKMNFFTRLKGFKEEENAIKAVFGTNIKIYDRENASEKNMFSISSPKVLHITTHGFFINDDKIIDPMLKSGIALSGANTKDKSGIVMALRMSGLKLSGTDMVVLSACETGVVDSKDTSAVAALPKTFIQAGAKNVMMSLWKVDDKQTVNLMSTFYEGLKDKNQPNYNILLKNSKIEMIKQDLHPYYWAGFIINGE